MIRANVEEDRETTIARFLNGLNREIANMFLSCNIVWRLRRWFTKPSRLSNNSKGRETLVQP